MHDFKYVGEKLFCERVSIESLVKKHGTPLYVYSQSTLEGHYSKLDSALGSLDHLICYAMKANSNLAVMRTFANLGSGFDTVSAGEIKRVITAGGDPKKCVFAGVGKTEEEIEFALRKGIYCFNAESEPELRRINQVAARLKKIAPVAVRVNPNIDAGTHAKITTGTYENKFGIAFEQVEGVYARASKLKNLRLRGIQMHIGSQLTQVQPFELAVRKVLSLVQKLAAKHGFEFFSIGGGLGIVYNPALASGSPEWWRSPAGKKILTPESYAKKLVPLLKPLGLKILLEPGRFMVGNAGILVTRVEHVKRTGRKNFVIVDAAMNDLIRPTLYEAHHDIRSVVEPGAGAPRIVADVVGPVCESGDFLALGRDLPRPAPGDLLAVMTAGAYGAVQAGTYNTRALVPEVLVREGEWALVRPRLEVSELIALDRLPPWQKGPEPRRG